MLTSSFRLELGALILMKARLGLVDEELVEQIGYNLFLNIVLSLEVFNCLLPFDPPQMVHLSNRLLEVVVNDCNGGNVVRVRMVIRGSDSRDAGDDRLCRGGGSPTIEGETMLSAQMRLNKGSLLIDATCALVDIRRPADLSLLNEATDVTEILSLRLTMGPVQ